MSQTLLDAIWTRRELVGKLGTLGAVVLAAPLAGCGAGPATPGSPAASGSTTSAASPAASTQASAGAAAGKHDVVKLGVLASTSDAGFYVGMEKGWYAEVGIEIQTTQFNTAAQMVAPLAQGQLDAGGGATSAGLNNALARDIGIKVVADKGFVPADSSYQGIVVRKDLAGSVHDYKDLKGFKLALAGEATSPQVAVDRALRKGGLSIKDVHIVALGFPDMAAAFAGKSIDAAHPIEPFTTEIPARDLGVIFKRSNEYSPNDQIAVVLYAPSFVKNRQDVARRFMVPYLRGVREYNDAFFKKPRDQKAYDEVIDVLAKNTTVKDKGLYAKMQLPALHPDGKVVAQSIKDDQDWYLAHGYQLTKVDIDDALDSSYAANAVKQLGGPYR